MTTCSPCASLNPTLHNRLFQHTLPLILTSHSFTLSSHFLGLTLYLHLCHFLLPFFPPSVQCWQSAEPIFTKLLLVLPSFLLDMLSCQAWNCSLSSPKNNYRETPASLKLTVSFPASFLLNTMCTLTFLIIKFTKIHTAGIDSPPIFIPVKDYTRWFHLLEQPESQRGGTDQRKHLLYSQTSMWLFISAIQQSVFVLHKSHITWLCFSQAPL